MTTETRREYSHLDMEFLQQKTYPVFLQGFGALSARPLRFGLFLILFYLIPYVAIWAIEWEMAYRHILAAIVFAGLVGYALLRRRKWAEMGFRLDTLKPAFLSFGVVTLFFTLLMLVVTHYQWLRPSSQPIPENWVLLYYVLIATPFQEFAYRGLLFSQMNRAGIRAAWAQSLISGILFGVLHIHYHDWVTFLITLMIGSVWGWLYSRHPNWLAIALSHAILGYVAMLTRVV